MRQAFDLSADRGVDMGVTVPVDIGPDRAVSIEIFLPFGIAQGGPFSGYKNQRVMIRCTPIRHLGKRMPEVSFIEVAQFPGVVHGMKKGIRNRIPLIVKLATLRNLVAAAASAVTALVHFLFGRDATVLKRLLDELHDGAEHFVDGIFCFNKVSGYRIV